MFFIGSWTFSLAEGLFLFFETLVIVRPVYNGHPWEMEGDRHVQGDYYIQVNFA